MKRVLLIAIVELPTNSLPALLPHFAAIGDAVNRVRPGEYLTLSLETRPGLGCWASIQEPP
jgi:hypothetical protein